MTRVILISGGTRGIGRATALRAAAQGDSVFVTGRHKRDLDRLLRDANTVEVAGIVADARRHGDSARAVRHALERFGRIDAVFVNAGIDCQGNFARAEPERWKEVVETNLLGAVYLVSESIASLARSRGHVLLMSSGYADRPPVGSLYAVTKSAIDAFAVTLRSEVGPQGVHVTVVKPGRVDTSWWGTIGSVAPSMSADYISSLVMWVLEQPAGVNVRSISVDPML